jgi:hypothetical protein
MFVSLFSRLERDPTFLVPINPPFADTAGSLCVQKLCNLPELQLDQIIKKKISNFSTDLFTEIVENAKLRSERWVMNQYRIFGTLQPGQPRVVHARDLMEDAAVIHSALGHQEMEPRVKVDPIPKGLGRGDDARRDIFLCYSP